MQKGHVAKGIERYALSMQAFLVWLKRTDRDHDPLTISRATVEAWQQSLFYDQGNVSIRTRSGKLSALRSFFAWLVYAGHRADDPTAGIPSPKIVPGQPQKFSTEELHKIFSAPDVTKPRGIRDLAILMTLYAAGPRVAELCNLETNQVLDTGGYIRLRFTGVKGGRRPDHHLANHGGPGAAQLAGAPAKPGDPQPGGLCPTGPGDSYPDQRRINPEAAEAVCRGSRHR